MENSNFSFEVIYKFQTFLNVHRLLGILLSVDSFPKCSLTQLRTRSNTISVSEGRSVLATDLDGFISKAEHGLFVHETRLLSHYRILVNGQTPVPVALSSLEQNSWFGYYVVKIRNTNERIRNDLGSGQVPPETQQALELTIARHLSGGIHEDIDLRNYTRRPLSFELAIEIDSDFADQFETMFRRVQKGNRSQNWQEDQSEFALAYSYEVERCFRAQNETGKARFQADVEFRISNASTPARFEDGRILFQVSLPPGGAWHTCLKTTTQVGDDKGLPSEHCYGASEMLSRQEELKKGFLSVATDFENPEAPALSYVVSQALDQAKADLASLRLYDLDTHDNAWTFAAGAPVYLAFFGRDTLTASWQAAMLGPEMMVGTLDTVARFQGERFNPWRDEEPGKMIHEAHTGTSFANRILGRRRRLQESEYWTP